MSFGRGNGSLNRLATNSPMSSSDANHENRVPDRESSGAFAPTIDSSAGAPSSGYEPTQDGSAAPQEFIDSQDATERLPVVAGYEFIEEIARGGMGVVYKGRDLKLNRTVAIKMILSGQFASQDQLRRFFVEAAAAARLDHSGIVPVYEMGQSEGRHFLTMKYAEGGSLADQLDAFAADPRAAVDLLAKVARAVHHAHQRGILHRDLKPPNILLDRDGEPLLSDLGLAKPIEGDSNITQTGAIVGTPSYMPPEQAAGKSEITTAADIYSLGAILFELLTGRLVFEGNTPVETVMKVLQETAPTPRGIDPRVDTRLGLICQKCLRRDPGSRYSSAAALADDLENWLAGRPISVVPPSVATAAFDWLRQNLRTALGAVIVGSVAGIVISLLIMLATTRTNMEGVYKYFPEERPWTLNLYSWTNSIPSSVRPLFQFVLMFVLAVVGLVNAAVVRPRSTDIAWAAGILAGLFAAVFSYAITLGTQPMIVTVIDPIRADTLLMSRTVWGESEGSVERARRAMLRRYPGLKDAPADKRSDLLFAKLTFDQVGGVPLGLWAGMIVVTMIVVAPIVGGTILARWLYQQLGSVGNTIGRYCEVAPLATACLVLIVIDLVPRTMSAPWPVRLLFYSAMLFSLGIGIRGWKWYVRIPIHGVWIALLVVNVSETRKTASAGVHAAKAAVRGDYQRSAEMIERYLAHAPSDGVRFQAAIARLYVGDETGYVTHCRYMISSYDDSFDEAFFSDRIAKTCLLRPDLQTNLPLVYELAEIASSYEDHALRNWFFMCRGLSEYRQRNFTEAVDWCRRARR